MTKSSRPLIDVQSEQPKITLPLNMVGIRGLNTLVTLPCPRFQSPVPARVNLAVSLNAHQRGTHMSRLVKCLYDSPKEMSQTNILNMLASMQASLAALDAYASFQLTLIKNSKAPASGLESSMSYPCSLKTSLKSSTLEFTTTLTTPVMTVCPCSLAICDTGAHSQRSLVTLSTISASMPDLEKLIEIMESSGSAPVYGLLKREDEKILIEKAFANPAFVEDTARKAADAINEYSQISAWKVEVESMESIHSHNAFAVLESSGWVKKEQHDSI